jgi:hypothetical protein
MNVSVLLCIHIRVFAFFDSDEHQPTQSTAETHADNSVAALLLNVHNDLVFQVFTLVFPFK